MKAAAKAFQRALYPVVALKDRPVLFQWGNLIFVTTGVINALAAVLSFLCALYLYRGIFPFETANNELAWNLAAVQVFSLVFSKAFHFFALGREFFKNPMKHLAETAFYNQGGQFGVFFGTIWLAWVTGINFFVCMDINLIAGCLAVALGRVGCHSYGCCHGRRTKSRFAVTYTDPRSKVLRVFPELKGVPLVPTQLMSAAFAFLLFFFMLALLSFSPRAGLISTFFIFAYNGFRIFIERYRLDLVDMSSKRIRNGFYIRIARFIVGIGAVYALAMLLSSAPKLALICPPGTGACPGVALFTPTTVAVSFAMFFLYVLTWGVHYKKLGQHFQ